MNTITHDIFVTVMPSKNFCKQMQRQARSTKMFKLLAVGAMVLAAATEVERRKLEEQVYQLSVRVKEVGAQRRRVINVRLLGDCNAQWQAWYHRDLSQVYHQEKQRPHD